MCHLRKGISHTSQPGACHLHYNKNKSASNIDPWGTPQVRFPGSENFLSILTLKVLPDKYDSNHEITFSENPMYPTF